VNQEGEQGAGFLQKREVKHLHENGDTKLCIMLKISETFSKRKNDAAFLDQAHLHARIRIRAHVWAEYLSGFWAVFLGKWAATLA